MNFVYFGKVVLNIPNNVEFHLGSTCFAYVTKLVSNECPLSEFIQIQAPFLSTASTRSTSVTYKATKRLPDKRVVKNPPFSDTILHLLTNSACYHENVLEYYSIREEIEELWIQPSSSLDELTRFVLMDCSFLKTLRIEDFCFPNLLLFMIANLPRLVTLQIGRRCCGLRVLDSQCCIITGCPELAFISIGSESFEFFQAFHLSGIIWFSLWVELPELSMLEIGEIGPYFWNSNNFKDADFILSSLPSLQSVMVGNDCFQRAKQIECCNLPSLTLLRLGNNSLIGSPEVNDATRLTFDCICFEESSVAIHPFCITCYGSNNFSNVRHYSCIVGWAYSIDHDAMFTLDFYGSNYFSTIQSVNNEPIQNVSECSLNSHSLFFRPYLFLKESQSIEFIRIDHFSVQNPYSFRVKGLQSLVSIQIGEHNFTSNAPHQKFCIEECDMLKSIVIEKDSFPSFTTFSLIKLPQLANLSIGSLHSKERNQSFQNCDVIVKGLVNCCSQE